MALPARAVVAVAGLLAACATTNEPEGLPPDVGGTPYTSCRAELRAFLIIAEIARQEGEDWSLYEPALKAMRTQVIDCVEEKQRDGLQT